LVAVVGASLALVPAVGAEPAPSEHDAVDIRERTDEILGRDEFLPPPETLLQRIGRWIAEHLLNRESDREVAPARPGGGGSAPLTVLFLALAAAAVFLAARFLLRQPRRSGTDVEDEPEAEVVQPRTVDQWLSAAERHEAAGEWKDGLRCRFRALVERLTERGVVPEIAGRTTGELRDDVRAASPRSGADFAGAADLFDRAWYGALDTGPDEARRFAEYADHVLASAATATGVDR